jgi:hypothetical protein
MTSLFNGATKSNVNDIGYYINVGDLCGKINAVTSADGVTYAVSTAAWATVGTGSASTLSSLRTAGQAVLKDMGKTIVSSLRTFRKVQLLRNTVQGPVQSTFGVGGSAGTAAGEDYLTGYIELGFEGAGVPAPVAHFGR